MAEEHEVAHLSHPEDPLAVLRRWEDGGGSWLVRRRSARGVDLTLLTCDGGEEMARLISGDPGLLAYLGDRTRSDDQVRWPDLVEGPDDGQA
jgi:hypothetical protein